MGQGISEIARWIPRRPEERSPRDWELLREAKEQQVSAIMAARCQGKTRGDGHGPSARLLPVTPHALLLALNYVMGDPLRPARLSYDTLREFLSPRRQEGQVLDNEAIGRAGQWLERRGLVTRARDHDAKAYSWSVELDLKKSVADPRWVLACSWIAAALSNRLTPMTLTIGSRLVFAADDDGLLTAVKEADLARVCGCDRKTVYPHLRELAGLGLIDLKQSGSRPRLWTISFDERSAIREEVRSGDLPVIDLTAGSKAVEREKAILGSFVRDMLANDPRERALQRALVPWRVSKSCNA